MKNYFRFALYVLVSFLTVSLTSCSGSDDEVGGSGALVGRWYHVRDVFDDGDVEECGDKNCYWDITSEKIICHDIGDVFYDKPVAYEYDGKWLTIGGFPLYEVKKLTSSELILFIDASYMTQTIYFKK